MLHCVLVLCLAVFFSLPGMAYGVRMTEMGPIPEPNEVILFDYKNYVGDNWKVYKLYPGRRYTIINSLGRFNDKTDSILVGKEVAVVVFRNNNLDDDSWTISKNTPDLQKIKHPTIHRIGVSSLMVIPKSLAAKAKDGFFKWHDFGVLLKASYELDLFQLPHDYSRFFPLPEDVNKHEARYPFLGGAIQAEFREVDPDPVVAGGQPWTVKRISKVDKAYVGAAVKIALYEKPGFGGKALHLPGPIPQRYYDLGKFNFADKANSLVVTGRGSVAAGAIPVQRPTQVPPGVIQPPPPPAQPPAPPPTPRPGEQTWEVGQDGKLDSPPPPPGPGQAPQGIPQLTGAWRGTNGLTYHLTQHGQGFAWTTLGGKEIGQGVIQGKRRSWQDMQLRVSWKGPFGRGQTKGKILQMQGNQATRIRWNNGIVFERQLGGGGLL